MRNLFEPSRIIQTPGRIFRGEEIQLLHLMWRYGFLKFLETKSFNLNSGIKSCFYVGGRADVGDNPLLEFALGRIIREFVLWNAREAGEKRHVCLMGIPSAGRKLAQAAVMCEAPHPDGDNLFQPCHRDIREVKKEHGAEENIECWVDGSPDFGRHWYWIIDNVITKGGSIKKNSDRLYEDGYPAMELPHLAIVDRELGGIERLKRAGFQSINARYRISDLASAFVQLGFWPESALKAIHEEIAEHQAAA